MQQLLEEVPVYILYHIKLCRLESRFIFFLVGSLLFSYMIWGNTFYYKLQSTSSILQREKLHNQYLIRGVSYLRSLTEDDLDRWTSKPSSSNQSSPPLCIAIYTNPRRVPYLQGLIASILMGNQRNDEIVSKSSFHILSTSSSSSLDETTTNWDLDFIQNKLPFIHIHHTKYRIPNLTRNYANLLNICVQTGSSWMVVFEDDAIVCTNFLSILEDTIFSARSSSLYAWIRGKGNTIAFIKLFVSDRWDGFENKDIGTLLLISFTIGIICYVSYVFLSRAYVRWMTTGYHRTVRKNIPLSKIKFHLSAILWISIVIFTNTVVIGRQNLCLLRDQILYGRRYRITPLEPYHQAATVATVYTHEGAKTAAAFLLSTIKKNETKVNHDVLLSREYLIATNRTAYEIRPVLVQHVGVYSSIRGKNNGNFALLGQNEGFEEIT